MIIIIIAIIIIIIIIIINSVVRESEFKSQDPHEFDTLAGLG